MHQCCWQLVRANRVATTRGEQGLPVNLVSSGLTVPAPWHTVNPAMLHCSSIKAAAWSQYTGLGRPVPVRFQRPGPCCASRAAAATFLPLALAS